MPPEAIFRRMPRVGLPDIAQAWRTPLANLLLAWLALIALTARDWAAMAHQWWNISTYNHVLFVPPIIVWVVWQRKGDLAKLTPGAWWPGLFALGGALFGWLIGTLAGFDIVSQLGAVLALIAAALTILGPRASMGLAFPLAYMVFLVPFGDELIPTLQMVTAKVVIWLVHLTGMQAQIEGVFIDTPAGLFEVAEACSGVMFLIAMLALAVLVANTCFVSWKRRAGFIAVALVLPIVANGVRAWGTIAIAQWQGIEFAAGFDHIFYGWIFFAVIVAALLGGAWRWFDREPDDPGIDAGKINASVLLGKLALLRIDRRVAVIAVFALALGFGGWALASERGKASLPASLPAPVAVGWQQVQGERPDWAPRAAGADRRVQAHYHDVRGRGVDVSLAVYAEQGPDHDAAAEGEGALPPDTDWRWLEPGASSPGWKAEWLYNKGVRRLARTTYRIGDLSTGSALRFKLATMIDRLLLRDRPAMVLIVSAEGPEANSTLDDFDTALGNSAQVMDRAAGLR
ncbi:exosortase A [Tsuneonella mangrovi]|uniref:exosortase A n=1 Tax=Tsuneonella mangrovi TaxID=1982042 RepID=UPI000BA27EBC|nr:exosortase A [Tsuneonella mangrovi]